MPNYWLDADSFIIPYRGPYRFSIAPYFWEFLEMKAEEKIIASPEIVFKKEIVGSGDQLEQWARKQQEKMFLPPTQDIQNSFRGIVDYVQNNNQYTDYNKAKFLDGADPWLIAYAKSLGGKIVTFEKGEPTSTKPKIPDVARPYNIVCINLWDLLNELQFTFRRIA